MNFREWSDDYEAIAKELIESEGALSHIKNSKVKIAYLSSDKKSKSGGRKKLGECVRTPEKFRWGIEYDFCITLFKSNIEGMSDEQIRTVMFHELLHIGIDVDMFGAETYSINPHDIEDFSAIIDRFGANWADFEHKESEDEEDEDTAA